VKSHNQENALTARAAAACSLTRAADFDQYFDHLHSVALELTGLLNRRSLLVDAKLEIDRCRSGRPLVAIMVDIDNFKELNDRYGYALGGEVIRQVAGRIQE
jgi:GGDEF domain-containing protein